MGDNPARETSPSCPRDARVSTTLAAAASTKEVVDSRPAAGHDGETGTSGGADRPTVSVTTLLAWLSPAFPVGGYAYSHGLEQAVEDGDVSEEASLETWLADAMALGFGRNDAILLQAAHRAAERSRLKPPSPSPCQGEGGPRESEGRVGMTQDRVQSSNVVLHAQRTPPYPPLDEGRDSSTATHFFASGEAQDVAAHPSLAEINELALAFAPTKELHLETSQQGRSFLDAVLAAWPNARLAEIARQLDGPVAYPVAVGAAAAAHDIPAVEAAAAFLVAIAQALVSAGVRLAPIGQTAGARIVGRVAPLARSIAEETATLSVDDLANATFRLDLGSARHETQYTRLFRS